MFSSAIVAGDAVASVRAGVDALLDADLTGLDQTDLLDVLKSVEVQTRRLAAVDAQLLAEIDQRGIAAQAGEASTATLLRTLVHCPPAAAKARVAAAQELCPRRGLTGESLEPIFPEVGAALATGSISPAHARAITALIDSLPGEVDTAFGHDLVCCLLAHAPGLDPHQLRRAGEELKARLDPDGPEPNDKTQQRSRGFTLHPRAVGGADATGRLTAAASAVWEAILDTLAAPQPATDGAPDPRTTAQRRHDALLEAGLRLLRSGSLPDCGGVPVTVLATLQARDLLDHPDLATPEANDPGGHDGTDAAEHGEGAGDGHGARASGSLCDDSRGPFDAPGTGHYPLGCRPLKRGSRRHGARNRAACAGGYATTGHGGLISIRELLTLAAEAEIIPVVLAEAGGILAYGRTRRLASPAQRHALTARDGGCSFPQCTRPASWCQVHHARPWKDGGATDISEMTLLCGFHHREFERRGWTCTMIDAVPYWVPPAWIDSRQRPIRNTAHHPDLDFPIEPDLLDTAHHELNQARAPDT